MPVGGKDDKGGAAAGINPFIRCDVVGPNCVNA